MQQSIALYVDGSEVTVPRNLLSLVQQICDQRIIRVESIINEIEDPQALELLTELYNRSAIWFESGDDGND